MKISSWNVNSVRARIINITDYLKKSKPDVLMMQEIKTEEKYFPNISQGRIGKQGKLCVESGKREWFYQLCQ